MPLIPLAPLEPRRSGRDPARAGEAVHPKRRAGRILRAVRYVASPFGIWAGTRSIRSSASSIGETVREARVAASRDPRFRLFPDGEFDLETTAYLFAISVSELERRLAARRRQTAWTAYLCLALAIASSLTWIGQVFGSPAEPSSVLLMANSMMFGGICLLVAFYQALVNFQLRANRATGWKEFLLTDRGFWPAP